MANLSSLEGTPWHITYLKSGEEGRRDRRGCKFYIKGNECLKGGTCYGGRYCKEYEKKNNIKENTTRKSVSSILKEKIEGRFKVKFEDDIEPIECEIGKNISEKAELVKIIMDIPKDSYFEINGEKALLIDKDISVKKYVSKK